MRISRSEYVVIVFSVIMLSTWTSFGSIGGSQAGSVDAQPRFRALVFSGTAGFRHESISAGIDAIRQLGDAHEFSVDATENPDVFTSDSLGRYDVVIFLNSSGDVLDEAQQAGFERYIRAGGGFAGIHGAAATEYDWAWYGDLVGAFFDNHPEPQRATVEVLDRAHPSTGDLPAVWERFDEWYNFRTNPRGDVHVLAVLEETSYEGGEMGHDHPISWAHEFDGGRAWYTGLGHTVEGYDDETFRTHLVGGIEWAAGVRPGDAGATLTGAFKKVVLMPDVTDPMEMGIDRRGRVFVAERSGPIKMWDPETDATSMVGFVPVRMTIEDGLLGLTLDPEFEENGWVYVYYAPADGGPQRLARWTFDGERLDPSTEKVLLEIRTQQKECCHSGGSLTFGPDGNLFLSTGDNTNPYPLGGSAMDERPGFAEGDAQRTSANTNDLRGKILRIRPLPDGTYAIPEGNLFDADSLHRPEIYTMGHRNPYRISVDAETGWLYWGDVGIGNAPSEARGPWGWEEFNQARRPGFYGWPYFAGPNDAYREFDYTTQTPGPFFDAGEPVNDSPNNTGARQLPPAQPALIWYTYGPSEHFPELGSGGMSAMAGPVYRYDESSDSPGALPAYYDGSFFIYEWMRHWVKEVKLDDDGRVLEINPFLPGTEFVRPTDMEIGPDGRLYVIEWGETFWGSNDDAQVVRLDYTDNRLESSGYGAAGIDARRSDVRGADSDRLDGDESGDATTAADRPHASRRPPVSFAWPPEGGIFDYDTPIEYVVERDPGVPVSNSVGVEEQPSNSDGAEGPPSSSDGAEEQPSSSDGAGESAPRGGRKVSNASGTGMPEITVRPFSGHDTHEHPSGPVQGSRGEVVVTRAFTHVPDIHYVDRFAVLEARAGPVTADRVVLRPRIVEAEHASDSRDAERRTVGKHPAEPDFHEAALTFMEVGAGGYLEFAPLNLTQIDTLVVRVQPLQGGTLEIRADGREGSVLVAVTVDSTSGLPARSDGGRRTGVLHGEALEELPDGVRQAYKGWRELRLPVGNVGWTERLFLDVRNDAVDGLAMRIDRLEFVGPGISKQPAE